jgi:hypothetical protein
MFERPARRGWRDIQDFGLKFATAQLRKGSLSERLLRSGKALESSLGENARAPGTHLTRPGTYLLTNHSWNLPLSTRLHEAEH